MDIKRQERAPIYEALEEFKKKRAGASARGKVCRA